MLVVGEREAAEGSVSIRRRDGQSMPVMKTGEFIAYVQKKVEGRELIL
jgi:threonyl-tRNA synthetase